MYHRCKWKSIDVFLLFACVRSFSLLYPHWNTCSTHSKLILDSKIAFPKYFPVKGFHSCILSSAFTYTHVVSFLLPSICSFSFYVYINMHVLHIHQDMTSKQNRINSSIFSMKHFNFLKTIYGKWRTKIKQFVHFWYIFFVVVVEFKMNLLIGKSSTRIAVTVVFSFFDFVFTKNKIKIIKNKNLQIIQVRQTKLHLGKTFVVAAVVIVAVCFYWSMEFYKS